MAATKYNIYVRYMNNNKVITEQSSTDWMSYMEETDYKEYYDTHKATYDGLVAALNDGTRKTETFTIDELAIYTKCARYIKFQEECDKGSGVRENVHIEPIDEQYVDPKGYTGSDGAALLAARKRKMREEKMARDTANQKVISDESKATNPKYDMIFMYDGLGMFQSEIDAYNKNPYNTVGIMKAYVYYDNMKRVDYNPWFFYAQFGSLQAAMLKAQELVNIMGPDGVMVGKDVSLDQYIDIV